MTILESDEVFYLEPIFVKGTPLAEALGRVTDDVLRECIRSWAGNVTYAEEVTEVRCIEYEAEVGSIEGIQSFLSLKKLMLNAWKYSLDPLKGLKYLQELRLYVHPDEDLSPLGQLGGLERLELAIFQEQSSCRKYAGTQWRCTGKGFENFAALSNLTKLSFLNLAFDNPDLEVVGKLVNLRYLHLMSAEITDISQLGGLIKLTFLNLQNNQIVEIAALEMLSRLKVLYLPGNRINDISILSGLKNLDTLLLNANELTDISALKGKKFSSLGLSGNLISDISPLRELQPPGSWPNNRLILDLRSNSIKVINGALDSIEKGDIYLEDNPLFCSEIEDYIATKPALVEVHYSNCVES